MSVNGLSPAASIPYPSPVTEGQVIQNAVSSGKGWVDSNTAAAVQGAQGLVNGTVDFAEQTGTAVVDQGIGGASNFADNFVQSLGRGVEQFVSGTLNVIETKLNNAIDKFVADGVKQLEAIPVVGSLLGGLIEEAGKAVEDSAAKALAAAGGVVQKEIYGLIATGEKALGHALQDLATSLEKPLDKDITSTLDPLKQQADGQIGQLGQQVQSSTDQGIGSLGSSVTAGLGDFAK